VVEEHLADHYIKLAPQKRAFDITFAHETGHVVLGILSDGKGVPKGGIASIPHTTSALTDRATAFNEGFAIHIETLIAHVTGDTKIRSAYHHTRFVFGESSQKISEYHRAGMDLRSYAQNLARYQDVRENTYAFASAFERGEYLRVQLDKARDFATLRDANQLLQSEGFHATFFFALTVRGTKIPDDATIAERQGKLFDALADVFAKDNLDEDSPTMLHFVRRYMEKYPYESREVADVLLDLSHGVFVDSGAAKLWREYYLGGIELDIKGPVTKKIEEARAGWRTSISKDPSVLFARLGPQISCVVQNASVLLVYFGQPASLSFDLNTVQPAIMRLIPGVSEDEVTRWITERAKKTFANADDFFARVGLRDSIRGILDFDAG